MNVARGALLTLVILTSGSASPRSVDSIIKTYIDKNIADKESCKIKKRLTNLKNAVYVDILREIHARENIDQIIEFNDGIFGIKYVYNSQSIASEVSMKAINFAKIENSDIRSASKLLKEIPDLVPTRGLAAIPVEYIRNEQDEILVYRYNKLLKQSKDATVEDILGDYPRLYTVGILWKHGPCKFYYAENPTSIDPETEGSDYEIADVLNYSDKLLLIVNSRVYERCDMMGFTADINSCEMTLSVTKEYGGL